MICAGMLLASVGTGQNIFLTDPSVSVGEQSGARIFSEPDSKLVIKPRPASRMAGEPPKPIEIERTSSFLIRKTQQERRDKSPVSSVVDKRVDDSQDDFSDNPVEWMLKRTDESLDAVEEIVPDAAKSAITYVTGNLGTNTTKYAADAAKIAVKGGSKLLEAAVPAGKWALAKGFGAVLSLAKQPKGKQGKKRSQLQDNDSANT